MNREHPWPRWSFWTWCFALLMTGGTYAFLVRSLRGLGPATHLNDVFSWGLGIGLDVYCGIALAAGGFTVAVFAHLLGDESSVPVVRASVLAGFLGYVVAVLGFISELGRPLGTRFLTAWNPRSVISGVAWVGLLYGAALLLEFAPELFHRYGRRDPPVWARPLTLLILLTALVLSTVHQVSLANLILSSPSRHSPIWFTPRLPAFFFVSACCAGLAVVIFASWHTSVAFARGLTPSLLVGIGRVLAVALLFYLSLRIVDLVQRGIPLLAWTYRVENLLLGLEICLFAVPAWLLLGSPNRRRPGLIYFCAVLVLGALVVNRLNTCITSIEATSGLRYLPNWNELILAYGVVALGIAAFGLAAKRLPIFPEL